MAARCILLFSLAVCAVPGSIRAMDYSLDAWSPDNGLPDSSVSALAQTPDGYLWIGTHNGLARFDGDRFVTFDPANTPELLHAHIRKLFVDHQGTLWVNTYDGSLTALEHGAFYLERKNARPSEAEITLISSSAVSDLFMTSRGNILDKTLGSGPETGWTDFESPDRDALTHRCEDGNGAVWYRDRGGNVWRYSGGQFHQIPSPKGVFVNCLATNAAGKICEGTSDGIYCWSGTKLEMAFPMNTDEAARKGPNNISFLLYTRAGGMWAVDNGRMRFASMGRWIPLSDALNHVFSGNLERVEAQQDGRCGVWFYNYGGGLLYVDPTGQSQELTQKEGFPRDFVSCFLEDREGNFWAGLDAGGVLRIRQKQFQVLAESRHGSARAARSICEDGKGGIWIGTVGGLEYLGQDAASTVSLPGNIGEVYCVCSDRENRLWMSAGDDEDLFVRENGLFKHVSPPIHGVISILCGHQGRLWLGTKGGLYRGDGSHEIQMVRGVPRHYIHALAEDVNGNLWAGAGNGDLYRVKDDSVDSFHAADRLASDAIWSVLPDAHGDVWAGTFRGGLLRWHNGKFIRLDKEDGLPDNVICQILDDGHGNLWLGSHHGVFVLPKSSLDEEGHAKSNPLPITTFGPDDGLPSLECSGNYQPAALRSSDGKLWFTTIQGVTCTQPGATPGNLVPPPVAIEDFKVDGNSFMDGKWRGEYASEQATADRPFSMLPSLFKLVIPPGARRFEFVFAGLSLAAPDQVRFRYRLEGLESRWVEAGTERTAQYSFLPPGRYRFHVIACNSGGVWNQTGSVLTLEILPFFYETWWFQALAALALITLVAGTVRHLVTRRLRQKLEQLRRQQAVERERIRIAKDLHDDLGASLTLIAVLGDLAQNEKTGERIERMSGTARQAVKSLDEIVWAVNPGNDTLSHLIDYSGQYATDYLRAGGVRCLLDVPDQIMARELSASVRYNLFLVVKEALQNIIKHAGATEVWLRFATSDSGLTVTIEDNGRGFASTPANGWADGLRNMSGRLNENGGACTVRSVVGSGTVIQIKLPWPPTDLK